MRPHPYEPRPRGTYIQQYRCPECGQDYGVTRCRSKPPNVARPSCDHCWKTKRKFVKLNPISPSDFVDAMVEQSQIVWVCSKCGSRNAAQLDAQLVCGRCQHPHSLTRGI